MNNWRGAERRGGEEGELAFHLDWQGHVISAEHLHGGQSRKNPAQPKPIAPVATAVIASIDPPLIAAMAVVGISDRTGHVLLQRLIYTAITRRCAADPTAAL